MGVGIKEKEEDSLSSNLVSLVVKKDFSAGVDTYTKESLKIHSLIHYNIDIFS